MQEQAEAKEVEIGVVAHYYAKIGVAVIEVSNDRISVGDEIHLKGHTTDLRQKIGSMQYEHENVEAAEAGQIVGLKVEDHVRQHDTVYKVVEG